MAAQTPQDAKIMLLWQFKMASIQQHNMNGIIIFGY